MDVSNSPSFADEPVMEFFRTYTKNLLEYSAKAGGWASVAFVGGRYGPAVGVGLLPREDTAVDDGAHVTDKLPEVLSCATGSTTRALDRLKQRCPTP